MWSALALGAMFGSLSAGKVSDHIGRKWAILVNAVPFAGGALLMVLVVNYTGLVLGRLGIHAVSRCASALLYQTISYSTPPLQYAPHLSPLTELTRTHEEHSLILHSTTYAFPTTFICTAVAVAAACHPVRVPHGHCTDRALRM